MNITVANELRIPTTISSFKHYYQTGYSSQQVIKAIVDRIRKPGRAGIWTYLISEEDMLERAKTLDQITISERQQYPLWGIPFSVKDCIDVAGIPTSCACPDFAYIASQTNPVVQKLLDAGAILIGKTNLDQFSTGLVGIRTGYDVPHNAFVEDYIPGGSSAGAALSVVHGLVSFAIGTDTGGSGRVPAGFNNIVGLKPTRGLLSTAHIVDACRSLDCVSIFALTTEDAETVLQVAKGFDPTNPFSRLESLPPSRLSRYQKNQPFRFGVPAAGQREFFGNSDVEALFDQAITTLVTMGGTCIEVDYAPFIQVNQLLFNGPWVAERYVSVGQFIEAHPQATFPITRDIILKSKAITAAEAFKGLYALATLKQQIQPIWQTIDVLVVPTTGTAYRIAEVEADPLALNANLGYYTNFVNLLDLAAIAIPNGFQSSGVPTGVTFVAPPYTESYLVGIGAVFHQHRLNQLSAVNQPTITVTL